MRPLVVACAAAIAGLAAPRPARADDDLAEARRLEAALDYDRALAVVDRALAHGGADPATLAELHLLAGRLAAGLDRPAVAEDHFIRALALRPDLALPAGSSPKLTAPFDAARARALAPLRLHATAVRGLVTLVVDADPLGLVAGVVVHTVDPAGHHAEVTERAARRTVIPPDTTAIEVAAVDAAGNRLWVGAPTGFTPAPRTRPEPASPAADEPARVQPDPSSPPPPPRWARASTWAVASGVAFASAAAFGGRASVAQDEWVTLRAQDGQHDFSQLTAVEARGQRWALAANGSMGLGAVAAGAAIYCLLRDEPAPRKPGDIDPDTVRYMPVAIGPLGLGVAGSF